MQHYYSLNKEVKRINIFLLLLLLFIKLTYRAFGNTPIFKSLQTLNKEEEKLV